MDPVSLAIIIAALILAISILVELNWRTLKPLGNRTMSARLLGVLRLIEGIATFTIAFIALMIFIGAFLRDSIFVTIISCVAGVVSATIVGTAAVKRGAKLRLEEIIEEADLMMKISENVRIVVETETSKILENAGKMIESAKDSIKAMIEMNRRYLQKNYENINTLQSRCEEILGRIQNYLAQTNRIVEGYNAIVQTYREEVRKLELLNFQIEEVTRMQEEYAKKLETLEQAPEERVDQKVRLTTANGIASRRLGNKAQHETAELLRNMGFEVEEHYGVGRPDIIPWWNNRRAAVVAHKAYTFTDKIRQRTITRKDIETEINAALKFKVPLVIIVTNLSNGRRYAEVIPYEKLNEFEKFTTPLILVDDKPETRSICEETLLKLKEILMR
ncbi:MAG: hypothetical protein QXS05_04360 [Candidatus Bathyarchaeia archaeon]